MSIDAAITEAVAVAMAPVLAELRALRAELARLAALAAPEPSMLSIRRFAERAGLSACTVRRRVSDGSLPSVRVGGAVRIPASALQPVDSAQIAELARAARRPRP
jgi:excisionase family DNA binding protein